MCARLLPIAFDFLAPTLIASTGYPTPLLHGKRGLHLLGVGRSMVVGGKVLAKIVRRRAREVELVGEIGSGVWRGIILARILGGEERRRCTRHGGLTRTATYNNAGREKGVTV